MAKAKKTTAATPVETLVEGTTEAVTPTAETLEPVQLTIADLQLLARIIDLASRRGAFQAGELSQVGDAYNKLASFLSYVDAAQKKEDEAKSTDAPTA